MSGYRGKLPPPNSLVAFEAAARFQNFTHAARELHVTQAAVSRQIRNLEDFLGFPAFERGNGRAQLTAEGKRLFEAVVIGLEHIAGTVQGLRRSPKKTHLTVASTISFASLWLIPRIATFRNEFPEIDLRFVSSDAELDLNADAIDVAIRYGDGAWPGVSAVPLLKPEVFPVCSPALLKEGPPLRTLSDLAAHTLLDREEVGAFGVSWKTWLTRARGDASAIRRRVLFNNYDLLVRAAIEGQGVALGFSPLVNELLRRQILVRPIARAIKPKESYYLVLPKGAPVNRNRDTFMKWIRRAALAS
jgi:DNA-binding transcriptional LysR family regulator